MTYVWDTFAYGSYSSKDYDIIEYDGKIDEIVNDVPVFPKRKVVVGPTS